MGKLPQKKNWGSFVHRGLRYDFLRKKIWTVPLILQFYIWNLLLIKNISTHTPHLTFKTLVLINFTETFETGSFIVYSISFFSMKISSRFQVPSEYDWSHLKIEKPHDFKCKKTNTKQGGAKKSCQTSKKVLFSPRSERERCVFDGEMFLQNCWITDCKNLFY